MPIGHPAAAVVSTTRPSRSRPRLRSGMERRIRTWASSREPVIESVICEGSLSAGMHHPPAECRASRVGNQPRSPPDAPGQCRVRTRPYTPDRAAVGLYDVLSIGCSSGDVFVLVHPYPGSPSSLSRLPPWGPGALPQFFGDCGCRSIETPLAVCIRECAPREPPAHIQVEVRRLVTGAMHNSDNGSAGGLRPESFFVPASEMCENHRSRPTVPGDDRRLCGRTSASVRFATSATAARSTKIKSRTLKTGKSST